MRGVAETFDVRSVTEHVPEVYSDAEAETVLDILRHEGERLRPYDGDFSAPWLLSPFADSLWHTTNCGREERIEGRWRHTINIDWNLLLPNGMRLTDPHYTKLLTSIKKLSVLRRSDRVQLVVATKSRFTSYFKDLHRSAV